MEMQDVVKKIFDIAIDNGANYRSMYIDENDNITLTIIFRKKEEIETACLIAVNMDGNERVITPSKIEESKTEKKPKTYLEDVLEKYPDVILGTGGNPLYVCPWHFGYDKDECDIYDNCLECWTQPMKKEESNESTDIC